METKRLKTDKKGILAAADILNNGGIVAIPTETVYGLAASALNDEAVKKIFIAKGRPQDNPLIVHVSDISDLEKIAVDIPKSAYTLARAFWPGPLTMVLKKGNAVCESVSTGLDTVAIRMPSDKTALEVIKVSGLPLAAPSANVSGAPSPTSYAHVLNDMDGKIDAVLLGENCSVGVESTVISLVGEKPRLLRPGGIGPEELIAVLGDLVVDKAVTAQVDKDEVVKAPGMKYRHYAPSEPVVIVSGSREKAAAYIHNHFEPGDRVLCFEEELSLYADCNPLSYGQEADVATLSAGLFAALRELDDPTIHQVYARCPVGGGIAYAVQNRLKKAAAFHIVDAEEEA